MSGYSSDNWGCDYECLGLNCTSTLENNFVKNKKWKSLGWDQCDDCNEWVCQKCKPLNLIKGKCFRCIENETNSHSDE